MFEDIYIVEYGRNGQLLNGCWDMLIIFLSKDPRRRQKFNFYRLPVQNHHRNA